jgi:hypothetical protein
MRPLTTELIIVPEWLPGPQVVRASTSTEARDKYVASAIALLAPVITIMRGLGLDEAGFRVAPGGACQYDTEAPHGPREAGGLRIGRRTESRETGDKLGIARDKVRAAADERGILFRLPDAVLGFRSDGITLFGEPRPGWLQGRLD